MATGPSKFVVGQGCATFLQLLVKIVKANSGRHDPRTPLRRSPIRDEAVIVAGKHQHVVPFSDER